MSMKVVSEDFPVTMETDVLVVGGGTAGAVAAIAAARNGAKTLILEATGALGGALVNQGVEMLHTFRVSYGIGKRETEGIHGEVDFETEQVVRGIPQEIVNRLIDIGGAAGKKNEVPYRRAVDPELYKLLMNRMCKEAGVDVLFQTYVVNAIKEGDAVKGVTFVNKSGKGAVLSKVVIDASGDADVAAAAGAEVMTGRNFPPYADMPMAASLIFYIGGGDSQKARDFIKGTDWLELLHKAVTNGDFTIPQGSDNFGRFGIGYPVFRGGQKRREVVLINQDMVYRTDATNAEQLSKAWVYARERVYETLNFFRKYIPGYENAYVILTSPYLGIRDSRNIVGDYVLTEEDFKESSKFPDAIGRSGRAMNVHFVAGWPKEMKNMKDFPYGEHGGGSPTWTETKEPYDIPYRALLPKRVENLLVAGKTISAKGLMQGSIRGMPQCMVGGQAAGTAAAIAVRQGVSPRRVDVGTLRRVLLEQGADLGVPVAAPLPPLPRA